MPGATREPWNRPPPGTSALIVKVRPDGSEATRYPGTILEVDSPGDWVAVGAWWTRDTIELDGLVFAPGDRLHEYFSGSHPFNVFAVFTAAGDLKGWYANVTYPSWMGSVDQMVAIYWHDLFIDVIGLPSGECFVRDEAELASAGGHFSDPELVETVHSARDELLRRLNAREFPFHER